LLLLLHARSLPRFNVRLPENVFGGKQLRGRHGLKMPNLALYLRGRGVRFMLRRGVTIIALLALGLALGGCSKCGPFWEDWMQPSPQKSCRSDHL
jgi:hypothetical protein